MFHERRAVISLIKLVFVVVALTGGLEVNGNDDDFRVAALKLYSDPSADGSRCFVGASLVCITES